MRNFRVPEWWDSIRAILSLMLSCSYCAGVLWLKIPKADLEGLKELATMAIVFYFVLKKRPDSNGSSDEDESYLSVPPSGVMP
jgi:hypothetical protein